MTTRLLRTALWLAIMMTVPAAAQLTTHVTAQVKDTNGALYSNCQWSVVFVGENTTPGAPPYAPANLLNGQQGTCDSFGNIATTGIDLADNINTVTPTPSQWSFSICSASGYIGGPFCKTNILFTITGTTQNLTAAITPIMPLLPTSGSGGPLLFAGIPTGACTSTQTAVNTLTGDFYTCAGGAWLKVGPNAAAGNPGGSPFSIQTNVGGVSFGGTGIGRNQFLSGTTGAPIAQNKAIYDVRDWMTCDGLTNASAGFGLLLNTIGANDATIHVVGQCLVGSLRTPINVTLDFTGGGSIALIVDHTAPGGGAFIDHSADGSVPAQANPAASPTSTCTATLNGTTGSATHDILFMVALYKTFGPDNARIASVTDGSNFYIQQQATTLNQAGYVVSYLASSISGGAHAITATFTTPEKNACIAWELSGLGPTPSIDNGTFAYGSTTPFNSGAATLIAGDFVAAYSEDPNDAQTCSAGAGYTQPAGLQGNVSSAGPSMCAEYLASGAGGSTSATQNFSTSPVLSSWVSAIIGLHPGIATVNVLGGIHNPDRHQIFFNATGTDGSIDFTNNIGLTTVYPEWWGANAAASAATNTAALQASIYGAFGKKRINGSGLGQWNKTLYLGQQFPINDELQFYHIIGSSGSRWQVLCNNGGITQTTNHKRILDGQSNAYGRFDNCLWQSSATDTAATALVDIGYSGLQGADLAPQFLDFYGNTFSGGNRDTGLIIAKEGGAAQGSNIYCYNCAFSGFTGAGLQVGGNNAGRNNSAGLGMGAITAYASNALAIALYGGDMQACPLYGLADYGGGYIEVNGTTFECTSPWASYLTALGTAVDVYCEAGQGPCIMKNVRSEDLQLLWADTSIIDNSVNTNQALYFYSPVQCLAGASIPLNDLFTGSDYGGDGALYKVTVHGTAFGGLCLQYGSSGSGTTIANTNQSVAGAVTQGAFTSTPETMTQAVTGSTGTRLNVPASTGTITGSVSSGTIGTGHTMTQATTGITCTSTNAPTGVQSLTCNNFSGTADNSHIWTDSTTSGTYTPSAAPAFSASNPAMIITAATAAPDNSHIWTGGTTGAIYTPTAVPASANYTVNAFTGQQVTIWGGTGIGQWCAITSNTADTFTCSAGWKTNFYGAAIVAADSTSRFIVEPNWAAGPTTSGDFTFARIDPEIIGGSNAGTSNQSSTCQINHVIASGGLIKCSAGSKRSTINDLLVSRPDWYGTFSQYSDNTIIQRLDRIQIFRPYGGTITGSTLQWTLGARHGTPVTYTGPSQNNQGTVPTVWSTGGVIGNNAGANDVWIGGRSDAYASTSVSRNVLEYGGILGRPSPIGTDQNGTATLIQGGLPTGSGTPGNIELWLAPGGGGSGSTVQPGAAVFTFTPTTITGSGITNLFASPPSIGGITPAASAFTTIRATGQITSTLASGTPPLVIASTDNISNLNASLLLNNTWAAPGPIGGTTPDAGTFNQLNVAGSGGFSVTSPGGTLPTPGGGTGGIGITTGAIPQFNPNNVGWFNIPNIQDCGTTSTCANTQKSLVIVRGSVAFPTATTVTVISLPFTSSASYSCTAGDATTAAGVVNATTYTSGASVTFTETGGANTDTMRYICAGF